MSIQAVDKQINKIRKEHDGLVTETVFGYEEGWWGRQRYTTKVICPDLKTFVDTKLLNSRMPETFDRSSEFTLLVADIRNRASGRVGLPALSTAGD